MDLLDTIISGMNYWAFIILMMIGLYAMITKKNLVKKLIGMSIFQTAILLFFISMAYKEGATIPILQYYDKVHAPEDYTNPLPHVLMLTAIVVGVSTLGVALSITQKLYTQFGTIEENEILKQLKSRND